MLVSAVLYETPSSDIMSLVFSLSELNISTLSKVGICGLLVIFESVWGVLDVARVSFRLVCFNENSIDDYKFFISLRPVILSRGRHNNIC